MAEGKVYEIIILGWPAEGVDDIAAPRCYAETYENAVKIARPWVEQGHDVAFRTVMREDEAHE